MLYMSCSYLFIVRLSCYKIVQLNLMRFGFRLVLVNISDLLIV